jgi:hypothetical protein
MDPGAVKAGAYLVLLAVAACGSLAPEAQQEKSVDVPVPSGPPIAQQADAVPSTAPEQSGPTWEATNSERGAVLRLIDPAGGLVMVLACRKERGLLAVVPSFAQIGSEDRLTLGFGDEPVVLVVNSPREGNPGVTAEGAGPPAGVIEGAGRVSAVYGAQKLGPLVSPPEALRKMLAGACT